MAEGSMSVAEREAFLADVHVGVLAVDQPGRGPLALPIWYLVEDGDVIVGMGGQSKKADLLRAAGRATLTVQTEEPPYRYASVEGPVVLEARRATTSRWPAATWVPSWDGGTRTTTPAPTSRWSCASRPSTG